MDYIDNLIAFFLIVGPICGVLGAIFIAYEKFIEDVPERFARWSKFTDSLMGE